MLYKIYVPFQKLCYESRVKISGPTYSWVTGKLKEMKNIDVLVKLLLQFSIFQCSCRQPISVADLG